MTGNHSAAALALLLAVPLTAMSQAVTQTETATGERRQQLTGTIYAGATYSDNEDHLTSQSHVAPEAGVMLNLSREQGPLNANVSGDVVHRGYQSGSDANSLDGALRADLDYQFIPDRFIWHVNDNFGQALKSQRAIDAPDNRQNFNYFSTGPSLRYPFSERMSLVASGQWGEVRYRSTDGRNNQRYSATLGLSRQLTEHSSLALQAAGQNVRYEPVSSASDFETRSAYLQLEAAGLKTSLNAEAGATRLTQHGVTTNEPLFNLRASRKLTPQTSFAVEGGEAVSDSADSFARAQAFSGYETGQSPDASGSGAYRSTHASALLTVATSRTSIDLSMHWERQKYQGVVVRSQERTGPSLQITRQMTARTSLLLHAAQWRNRFLDGGSDNDESSYGIGLNLLLTERLGLNALYDHRSGSGLSTVTTAQVSYQENQASLRLTYRVGR